MDHSVFRQKSMERITSPEQMNDYIRVSNPSVWMLLAAVIVLLIGVCVWGAFGHLDTVVQTGGICEDGRLTVYLSESDFAKLDGEAILSVGEAEYAVVSDVAGMPILLDESTDPYLLHLIGLSAGDWAHALSAEAPDLKDGVYTVSVIIERVRPLDFVLN